MDVPLSERITVTIADACKLTSIGRKQLCDWIKDDINFPSFKVGSKTMIAVEPLRKYIADKAKIRIGEPIHNERIAAIYARREARGFQAKVRLADVNGKRTAFEMR